MAESMHSLATPTSIDQALVTGAGFGAAVLCPWLWLIATLAVFDALRGRVATRVGWTRRLTLLACGVAVTTSFAAPSHAAATDHHETGGSAESISLDGLPYPERASGKQHESGRQATPPHTPTASTAPVSTRATEPSHARPGTHQVCEGDTLWAIADAMTTSTDLPRAVAELHQRNRRVIGDNPDLIRPGQVLDLHSEGDEPR